MPLNVNATTRSTVIGTADLQELEPSTSRRPRSWSRRQRRKNDLLYALAMASMWVARRLPYPVLVAWGTCVGILAFVVFARARSVAVDNLALLGTCSRTRRLWRALRTFARLGALLGDTIALFGEPRASERLPLTEEAAAWLERARRHARGVVLLGAHFGPWERMAGSLAEACGGMLVPTRRCYDPRLERRIVRPLRRQLGVRTIERDSAGLPKALLATLRRGGVVGMLVDLRTRATSRAVMWFGRSVHVPVAPAALALRSGASVAVALPIRGRVHLVPLREPAFPRTGAAEAHQLDELLRAIYREFELAIQQDPTAWVWMHDRFREVRRPERNA